MDSARTEHRARRGGIARGLAPNGPAILSYGFRPFFLGAGVWALVAMGAWVGALVWGWAPGGDYGALNWHAHEMLFGYAGAALAGFMLTAIPNWTGRLPVSGAPLAALVLLWALGRVAMLWPDPVGLMPAVVIDALFFPVLGLIALREIVAGRNWRNLHVVAALSALSVANIWFHRAVVVGEDTGPAYRFTILIWIMLISLIGGRLATSFTRNWLARRGETRFPASMGRFDLVTLIFGLVALVSWVAWPESPATGVVCVVGGMLHAFRLMRWRGWTVWREPLVLVLHTSYAFVSLGFITAGAAAFGLIGTVSALHVLTVGAIGGMTLAVMTRASRGHTGRPLTASPATTTAYAALIIAGLLRPFAEFIPDAYSDLLSLSGLLWVVAFALFVLEYGPMHIGPRR